MSFSITFVFSWAKCPRTNVPIGFKWPASWPFRWLCRCRSAVRGRRLNSMLKTLKKRRSLRRSEAKAQKRCKVATKEVCSWGPGLPMYLYMVCTCLCVCVWDLILNWYLLCTTWYSIHLHSGFGVLWMSLEKGWIMIIWDIHTNNYIYHLQGLLGIEPCVWYVVFHRNSLGQLVAPQNTLWCWIIQGFPVYLGLWWWTFEHESQSSGDPGGRFFWWRASRSVLGAWYGCMV